MCLKQCIVGISETCRLLLKVYLLDIMYFVLLLFNDNLLIFSHSLILNNSLLISDVMFVLLSSLNESIVLESGV